MMNAVNTTQRMRRVFRTFVCRFFHYKFFRILKLKIKKESCLQDSPPATGRFSDIIPPRRSAILPGGLFYVIGTLRSNFL